MDTYTDSQLRRLLAIFNRQQMSTKVLQIIVFSVFHQSLVCFIFLFCKLARKTLSNSEPTDIPAMDVFFVLLLNALVMYVIELWPSKGAITRFLSRMFAVGYVPLPLFFCCVVTLAHFLLIESFEGPWKHEAWLYLLFLICLASFFALYASKEVSSFVSDVVAYHLMWYTAGDLWEGHLPTILAGFIGISIFRLFFFYRVGGLRYADKEPDVISVLSYPDKEPDVVPKRVSV